SASEASGFLTRPLGASPRFTVNLDARMGSDGGDALFGFSNGAAFDYTDLAAIARFNPEGLIDARDGGTYRAEGVVPYRAGRWAHLRFDIDLTNRRYSLDELNGQFDLEIGRDYRFRTEQANTPGVNSFVLKTDDGGP